MGGTGGREPRRGIGILETLALLIAIAVLSTLTALPKERVEVLSGGANPGGVGGVGGAAGGGTGVGTGIGAGPGSTQGTLNPSDLECKGGRNGDRTDVGVTGTTIKLGATVVDTGIGAAFLSDVRYGMLAVVNKVNAGGGICGRRLQLVLKDDGWDPQRGKLFIENLVEGERVFALAVVPSSEGLRAAGSYVQSQGVPVVGTDGMLIGQYTNPVIWPVASSTITAMHIMAKSAYDAGARHFAMVYDSNFRFGVEGAYAFNQAVKRLTGASVPGYSDPLQQPKCSQRFCGIKAGQPSYQTELEVVRSACNQEPTCDYLVYLLEPETALTWMRGGGLKTDDLPGLHVAGPQPLFNRSFGVNCAQRCHKMAVWSGFVPPIQPFTGQQAVAAYVQELASTNAQADPNNSFVEGGYIGMKLLVDALRKVGPGLTRRALVAALDSSTLDTGLSKPLTFRAGQHFADACMMRFSIQSVPTFAGWRQESDWICDPWLGQDIPADES